jgi:hemolysin III
MRKPPAAPDREQSRPEEITNSLSHGLGGLAALIGAPLLIRHAARHGDPWFMIGASVFVATIILLYLASTLYHALPTGKAKRLFRHIEHSAIFLLIAGTYTPLMLGVLRGAWGWSLLGIIWAIAGVGVILRIFEKVSFSAPKLATGLYLLMGWVIVVAIVPLSELMPTAGLIWLVAGGLAYTAGVVFYVTDARLRYGHLVWHLFVMAGTACHYFAVFRSVG